MASPNSIPKSSDDYFSYKTYTESVNYIQSKLHEEYKHGNVRIGIVCGSGLGGLAQLLEEPLCEFDYKDIPHFGVSTVKGHAGKFVFGKIGGHNTVCMVGRKHVFEGHASVKTAFPIRIMKLLGAKSLLVTNATLH